ncbi:MAG: U32 family peptidase [Clostridiales bacterium]|nr:U32 family peptidase [Clostridiales bacterium]
MSAEILSPCGSVESLNAAIRTGCTAVYAGSKRFSARQGAENFDDDQLKQAIELCHKHGIKFYQAINTVATDSELYDLSMELKRACEYGVDAIITQDLALVDMVEELCPNLEIHASTQMTIHSPMGIDIGKAMGFSRVVASRELSLEQIKSLCNRGLEIEVFVHGALCMSVSGQCYMSAMIGSRSANRGRCAQACRLPFSDNIKKGGREYSLSLKDLSLVSHLRELEDVGVSSMKIEGRMKRPEYVASATDVCAKSLSGKEYDLETLKAVFSRSGFTDGYLTGKRYEMFGTRQKEDVVSAKDVLPQLKQLYRKERKSATLSFNLIVKTGRPACLEAVDNMGNTASATLNPPEPALNRPLTKETAIKQISKLGDTIYEFNKLDIDIDEGVMIPLKDLNTLRRQVCEEMDQIRISANSKVVSFIDSKMELDFNFPKLKNIKQKRIRLDVTKAEQLRGINFEEIEFAIVPLIEVKNCNGLPIDKIALSLPRFINNEEKTYSDLKKAKEQGFSKIYASNYAHIEMGNRLGLEIHGDFGLNPTNSLAVKKLSQLGISSVTMSLELKAGQINRIGDFSKLGIVAYGKIPLMLTRNCPISDCSRCTGFITDRTNRSFNIQCNKNQGYVEVLNCDTLWLADKLEDFNVDFITLKFSDETVNQTAKVLKGYLNGEVSSGAITRGLYYRGII